MKPLMAGKAPFTTHGELTGTRDNYVHFEQEPYDQNALQRHLSEVTQVAVRLAGPHPDTAQERDRFERLEEELDAVLARWS